MNEERKIEVEEVDAGTRPPRARVTPDFERKRDYLAGFLAGETESAPSGEIPNEELRDAVIEVLKSIYDPEIPVDIYELGLIYDVAISEDGDATTLLSLCRRLVMCAWRTGPPWKKISPPTLYFVTSLLTESMCAWSLFEYTGIMMSCAMRSSGVMVLNTESTQAWLAFRKGGSVAGLKGLATAFWVVLRLFFEVRLCASTSVAPNSSRATRVSKR